MKLVLVFVVFIISAKANDTQIQINEIITKLPKYKKLSDVSRVVGGAATLPHVRKYQVALLLSYMNETYICGGTLISQKYVLTAAHCLDQASNATVVLGAYNILIDETNQIRRFVSKSSFRIHEGWNWQTGANDIATFSFRQPVNLNEFIQLVQLPSFAEAGASFALRKATVVGWGKSSQNATGVAPLLQESNATVLCNFACSLIYKALQYRFGILDSQICAVGGRACIGDSGGPLLIGNKQIGIVSWGYVENCDLDYPSVYTRITPYLLWIQANSDVLIYP